MVTDALLDDPNERTIEKKELNFDPRMGFGVLTVLYSLLAGVMSISDSPIKFKSLILTSTFSSMQNLQDLLIRNYIRQGAL